MTRTEIVDRWTQHVARPFPREYAGVEIAGVCVTSCDSVLAGCISYFVKKGALDPKRMQVAVSTCSDIERALSHLDGDARIYFEELLILGRAVVLSAQSEAI